MFDKESSIELYKKFILIGNESNDMKNPLYDNYKIDDVHKSILLQSIQISMPKINLTNVTVSKKIETFEKNEKYVIRYDNMPKKFQQLFDLANIKLPLF